MWLVTASWTGNQSKVTVHWETGHELRLLGFNVYRIRNGIETKLNSEVIFPKNIGMALGTTYKFFDTHPGCGKAVYYRIEALGFGQTENIQTEPRFIRCDKSR